MIYDSFNASLSQQLWLFCNYYIIHSHFFTKLYHTNKRPRNFSFADYAAKLMQVRSFWE